MRDSAVILLASAALCLAVVPARAAGARTYDLTGFDRIDASAGVTVILAQGPFSIRAEEFGGNFDRLRVEAHGSTLVVTRTPTYGWFWPGPDRHYTVTVTAPAYTGVSASSGSSVSGQINTQALELSASSGAHLRLSGTCAGMTATASSGASLDGADLKCKTARLEANSGASLRAWADTSVTGNASSGANIRVGGKAPQVSSRQSSGGSLRIDPA